MSVEQEKNQNLISAIQITRLTSQSNFPSISEDPSSLGLKVPTNSDRLLLEQ